MNWNFDLPNDWFDNTKDVSRVSSWEEPYGVWKAKIVEPYFYKTDSGATMFNFGMELLNEDTGEVINWNPKLLFRSGDAKGNKFGWEKNGKLVPFEAHDVLGTLKKMFNIDPLKNIQNTTIKNDWDGSIKEVGLLTNLIDKQIIISNKKKYDDFRGKEIAYISNIFSVDIDKEELEKIKEKTNKQVENYVYKSKDNSEENRKENNGDEKVKSDNYWGV